MILCRLQSLSNLNGQYISVFYFGDICNMLQVEISRMNLTGVLFIYDFLSVGFLFNDILLRFQQMPVYRKRKKTLESSPEKRVYI